MPSSDLDDIIARAAEDRPFRKRLVLDPEETAKSAGYRLTKEDIEILRVMAEDGEEAFFGGADEGTSKGGARLPVDEFLRTGGTGVGIEETVEDEELGWEEEAEPEEEPEEEA
jgi:hypothetical protein